MDLRPASDDLRATRHDLRLAGAGCAGPGGALRTSRGAVLHGRARLPSCFAGRRRSTLPSRGAPETLRSTRDARNGEPRFRRIVADIGPDPLERTYDRAPRTDVERADGRR